MLGTIFPVSILVNFESSKIPDDFIQQNVLQFLLNVQQKFIGGDEYIRVLTPNFHTLSVLPQFEGKTIQSIFTSNLDELFQKGVEACLVYTDNAEFADKISELCNRNEMKCLARVFAKDRTPLKPLSNDRVTEATIEGGKKKSVKVIDVASVPRQSGHLVRIVRKDGFIEGYYKVEAKKKELHEHATKSNELKEHKQRIIDQSNEITDPVAKKAFRDEHLTSAHGAVVEAAEKEKALMGELGAAIDHALGGTAKERTHLFSEIVSAQLHDRWYAKDAPTSKKGFNFLISKNPDGNNTLTLYKGMIEGVDKPVTTMERHWFDKAGGASDEHITELAHLGLMHLEKQGILPDQIVTPPITWRGPETDDKGNVIYATPEEKAASLIHVRVAKKMVELSTMAYDTKTGARISMDDLKKKMAQNDFDPHSVDFKEAMTYDPMYLGTKSFEVKMTGFKQHDPELERWHHWEQNGVTERGQPNWERISNAQERQYREDERNNIEIPPIKSEQQFENLYQDKEGNRIGKAAHDRLIANDPESATHRRFGTRMDMIQHLYDEALFKHFDENHPGPLSGHNILLLDDNVDSGVTFKAVERTEMTPELSGTPNPEKIKYSSLAIFDMSAPQPSGDKFTEPEVKKVTGGTRIAKEINSTDVSKPEMHELGRKVHASRTS